MQTQRKYIPKYESIVVVPAAQKKINYLSLQIRILRKEATTIDRAGLRKVSVRPRAKVVTVIRATKAVRQTRKEAELRFSVISSVIGGRRGLSDSGICLTSSSLRANSFVSRHC